MNLLKKIYCRTFQSIFKIAIPILPYRSPLLLNSILDIPKVLVSKQIDNVLIITDKSLHDLRLTSSLEKALTEKKINYIIFDETVANPTIKNVEDAKRIYTENNCNGIIGFGGGSSIDCAKAAGARIARPNLPIAKMEGILKIHKKTPYTIAVPTTAGTGSETTLATVITDGETRHKFPINDFPLIPDVAVLDPETTKSLPPSITAATGMDALTHAVEAFIGRSTVKSTEKDAVNALKLICDNLETAYSNGNDITARANMLYASFLAGRAFSKSYVGYCHAVAHSLGGKYNTPHGLANAVILPYVLEEYGKSAFKKLKKLAVAINIADESTPENIAATRFIDKIREMNKNMGIPEKLRGIKKEDIYNLSLYAEKEANPLYPVPKLMSREDIAQIYYKIMEENQ